MVIGGDYITTESGTGLVHTAPGHGQEYYQTGLKYDLPLYSPVDDAGDFTEDAGGECACSNPNPSPNPYLHPRRSSVGRDRVGERGVVETALRGRESGGLKWREGSPKTP